MMNDAHEAVKPLLSAYLDGELNPARRGQVAAHLATCALCTQELAHLQAGDEALAGLRPTPPAPDLREHLRRRLRRQGARTALRGWFIVLTVLLLRSMARDLAVVTRKDLPLWGRLGLASGSVLMLVPGIALCVELLRDVRTLVEYAWLSDETIDSDEAIDSGEAHQ
jgi:anti-sigma factor RsiW